MEIFFLEFVIWYLLFSLRYHPKTKEGEQTIIDEQFIPYLEFAKNGCRQALYRINPVTRQMELPLVPFNVIDKINAPYQQGSRETNINSQPISDLPSGKNTKSK